MHRYIKVVFDTEFLGHCLRCVPFMDNNSFRSLGAQIDVYEEKGLAYLIYLSYLLYNFLFLVWFWQAQVLCDVL